jgi:vesicle-fusing ATPase
MIKKVTKVDSISEANTNCVFTSIKSPYVSITYDSKTHLFRNAYTPNISNDIIKMNPNIRSYLNTSLDDRVVVEGYSILSDMHFAYQRSKASILIEHKKHNVETTIINPEEHYDTFFSTFNGTPLNAGCKYTYNNNTFTITPLENVYIERDTKIEFTSRDDSIMISTEVKLFKPTVDFKSLGIGGLHDEFNEIIRRVFTTRLFSPDVVKRYNIRHTKGIILYGPPGCGKTLIARKISELLNCKEMRIVNGPEILNKYVGESERAVRDLFALAEEDQRRYAEYSGLHVIILDEFDAIVKSRNGNTDAGSSVSNNMVNQFLSKIDGVNQLNNVLLIGMTNRLDLIDPAILRAGRFDVKIHIGLPSASDRVEIFKIHTQSYTDNIDPDVSFDELALRTDSYSGAEIASICSTVLSTAMNRSVNINNGSDIEVGNISLLLITNDDFNTAIHDICSSRTVASTTKSQKQQSIQEELDEKLLFKLINDPNGNTDCHDHDIDHDTTSIYPCFDESMLRTTIAECVRNNYNIKLITAGTLLSMNTLDAIAYVNKIFYETIDRDQRTVIVFKDIDLVVEYVEHVEFDEQLCYIKNIRLYNYFKQLMNNEISSCTFIYSFHIEGASKHVRFTRK